MIYSTANHQEGGSVGLKKSKTWWRNTWMVPYLTHKKRNNCMSGYLIYTILNLMKIVLASLNLKLLKKLLTTKLLSRELLNQTNLEQYKQLSLKRNVHFKLGLSMMFQRKTPWKVFIASNGSFQFLRVTSSQDIDFSKFSCYVIYIFLYDLAVVFIFAVLAVIRCLGKY